MSSRRARAPVPQPSSNTALASRRLPAITRLGVLEAANRARVPPSERPVRMAASEARASHVMVYPGPYPALRMIIARP